MKDNFSAKTGKRIVRQTTGLLLLFVICGCNLIFSQTAKIDSIKKVLAGSMNDTSRINSLSDLARNLGFYNPDTAIIVTTSALGIIEQSRNLSPQWKQVKTARFLHQLGTFNSFKGNFSVALDFYFKALPVWEKLEKEAIQNEKVPLQFSLEVIKSNKSLTLGNIGIACYSQGDYPRALEYYLKALKIEEASGNKAGITRALSNMGIIYLEQGKHTEALDHFYRALKLDEELQNTDGIARELGNIGLIHTAQGNRDKALECYQRVLKMHEETGNKSGIATQLANIGVIEFEKGNYASAVDYYLKTLKISEELADKRSIAIQYGNLGLLYFRSPAFPPPPGEKKRGYALSRHYLESALAIGREVGDKNGCRDWEQTFSELERAQGNYRGAYDHYKYYIAYRDSLANDENTKKQTQIEMQYGFEKKDAETRAAQDKKDALQAEEKRKQTIILWSVVSGLVLVLAFAIFIFRSFRQKQKANIEISKQKEVIEEKQKEILDSIYYARRIQRSLLPTEKYLERNLKKTQKNPLN
jgi:tetratricopeptide (TPR) repeat protein